MSASTDAPVRHDVCDHEPCDTSYAVHGGDSFGGFCSEACYHRHTGANVLDHLIHDHRFCGSCFRPIKTVDKPTTEWLDNVGSHVQVALNAGARLRSIDSDLQMDTGGVQINSQLDYTPITDGKRKVHTEAVIGEQYMTEHTVRTPWGWSCECGNTDHTHREPAIIDVEIEQVIVFLYRALQQLYSEGHISQSPSRQELFAGLREHWKDWEYAIGRCLHK